MNNQETRFVDEIIRRFHSGRFSRKVVRNFHLWLLSSRDYTVKDQAMNEIWLELPHSVTRSVCRSLHAVKSRLGMGAEPRRKSMRLGSALARVAAILLPAALIVGTYFISTSGAAEAEWARVDVPNGETGSYTLADGTEVRLNSGSSLEYPVEFKGRKRDVKLYGEGFFDVTPDKRKPFTVHTPHMSTKVVGTEFNISCYDNQKSENVTVMSGRVEVTTPDNETHSLTPGRTLTYWIEEGQTDVKDADAASAVRWMYNGLVFENSTFEDILNTLQRKYNFTVVVDTASLTEAQYRMKFVNGESLDYILDVVHSVAGHPYKFENRVLTVGGDLKNAQELAMRKRLQQSAAKH